MREVVIEVWCDAHGRGTPATRTTPPVPVKGKPKVADLCDECWETYADPLLSLLETHGADPEDTSPPPPTPVPCPVCGDESKDRRALATHLRTIHKRSIREFTSTHGGPLAESHPTPLRSTA